MRSIIAPLAALAALVAFAPSPAQACGGFFCNNNNPVNQAGEQVIFGVEGDGKIEMWIRVFYEGEADEFAWVLPVPTDPTVGVGVERFFDDLLGRTNIVGRYVLRCSTGDCEGADCDDMLEGAGADGGDDGGDGGGGGVTVLQQGQTGPYDFVVLSGEDAGTIVEWLTEADYDVGDIGEELLQPYITDGQNLLAMRLQKGKSAGDLQPIRLTFDADMPVIPLRLTAVAATPDMPVHVWVFGAHRAVPTNFEHVILNPVLLFGRPWEFQDNLNRAMNEAGGRAFSTFAAVDPTSLNLSYIDPDKHTVDGLEELDDAVRDLLGEVVRRFGWQGTEMTSLLQDWFPLAEGFRFCPWEWRWRNGDEAPPEDCVNEEAYYNGEEERHSVYPEVIDIPALQADLEERIVTPRVAADRLLDTHDVVTRLSGTISPEEMTADPGFRLVPDAPLRPRVRQAAVMQFCEDAPQDECWWDPPKMEFYEGGLRLATGGQLEREDRDRREALFGDMPATQVIERWGDAGDAEVTTENTEEIHALAREASALIADLPAGAFDNTPPPSPEDEQCGEYMDPSDEFGGLAEAAGADGGGGGDADGDAGGGDGDDGGVTGPQPWDRRPDGTSASGSDSGRTRPDAGGCACEQPGLRAQTPSSVERLLSLLALRR